MHSYPLLILALVFFAFFLTYARLKRLPASKHMYRDTNRAHFILFIAYTVTSVALAERTGAWNEESLVEGALGAYVYFSLYYAFVFPLIGLAKNSISINILTTIRQIEVEGLAPVRELIHDRMTESGLGPQGLRESRLYQLTYLGLATHNEGKYRMTVVGRIVYRVMAIILSVWRQNRL